MDTSEIKKHILKDEVIFTRGKQKLYGFKLKVTEEPEVSEITKLFRSEANRWGGNKDEFNIAQMRYDGYIK